VARFFPPIDFTNLPPVERAGDYAERKVLEALSRCDNDWHVFHGTTWRTLDRHGERTGEVDLIIFHPDHGILFVEVKGGGVKLEAGVWYYLDPHTGEIRNRMKMSPVGQAARNQYFFKSRLDRTMLGPGILTATAVTHTAWFPDIEWQAPLPPEIPAGSYLLDARHLGDPAAALRAIFSQSCPRPETWTQREINVFIQAIAPEVNLAVPLGAILGDVRDRLFRLTDAQLDALQVLKTMNRLLVEGCAGSGKTLLAVRLAREHLLQGKHVLLTCFNKHLASALAAEFVRDDAITVSTFHELVRQRCERHGIPYEVPTQSDQRPDFFRNSCPDLLMRAVERDDERYDSIIVDEAFDFLETWWIALEGVGASGCSMYAFYDTKQGVFNEEEDWQPPFAGTPIRLDTNLRNTKPVGDLANRIGMVAEPVRYAVPTGPEPVVIPYDEVGEQAPVVLRTVRELTSRGRVPAGTIVVLSPYRPDSERVGLGGLLTAHTDLFTADMGSTDASRVRVGTIQSFKGLEADVVILCGLDGARPACKPANLYVGATRARSMLYLLHHKDVML
jgi:hypothetical protein